MSETNSRWTNQVTWLEQGSPACLAFRVCLWHLSPAWSKCQATQWAAQRQGHLQKCTGKGGSLWEHLPHLSGQQFPLPPALGPHTAIMGNKGDNGYEGLHKLQKLIHSSIHSTNICWRPSICQGAEHSGFKETALSMTPCDEDHGGELEGSMGASGWGADLCPGGCN